jgi:hypothetical protein
MPWGGRPPPTMALSASTTRKGDSMSDNETAPESEEAGPAQQGDVLLAYVVDMLNRVGDALEPGQDVATGISLVVAGRTIAGELVNAQAWLDEEAARFRAAGEDAGELARVITESLARGVETVRAGYEPDSNRPVGFLHLRNVTVFDGGSELRSDLMRVRIESVDAWTMGHWERMPG